MQITFHLPHVFSPISTSEADSETLRVLLDTLTTLNRAYLRSQNGAVPSLYRSGVVYGRTTLWEPIPALYARRYGDCKSLSAALLAEYQLQGRTCSPVFRWIKHPDGRKDFHILVLTENGFEDPSKVCGMKSSELAYFDR